MAIGQDAVSTLVSMIRNLHRSASQNYIFQPNFDFQVLLFQYMFVDIILASCHSISEQHMHTVYCIKCSPLAAQAAMVQLAAWAVCINCITHELHHHMGYMMIRLSIGSCKSSAGLGDTRTILSPS